MKHTEQLFTEEIFVNPSEKLAEDARAVGVDALAIMRDYIAYKAEGGQITVAVGDMANNLTGTTYRDEALAAETGLPKDYTFNGGLIGSLVLRRELDGYEKTGATLVEYANAALAGLYSRYRDDDSVVPADERFTGYLTHALVGQERTILTAVGDVSAWVNGVRVLGEEKAVDTRKILLVDDLEENLKTERDLIAEHMHNIIDLFAQEARLDREVVIELSEELQDALEQTDSPDRQTMYRPVDRIVTRWQILTLQNRQPDTHPWAYGAIDGSKTPEVYIDTHTVPTENIETLVIATDGSRPRTPDASVHSVRDLVVVNPRYSEQAIVALERRV